MPVATSLVPDHQCKSQIWLRSRTSLCKDTSCYLSCACLNRSPHAALPAASPSANPFGFSSGSGFNGSLAPAPCDRPGNRHRALHSISEAQLGGAARDADMMDGGAVRLEDHRPEYSALHKEQHQQRQQHQGDSRHIQKRQPSGSLLDRHTNGHHVGGSGSHSQHQNGGHSGRERALPQSPKSPSAQVARRTKLAFRSGQVRAWSRTKPHSGRETSGDKHTFPTAQLGCMQPHPGYTTDSAWLRAQSAPCIQDLLLT